MAAVTFWVKEMERNRANSSHVCQVVIVFLPPSFLRLICCVVHPVSSVSALLDTCYPSSISPGFSSERGLSYYLIKHPRDALEVIGFGTRGKGHRAEFVCVCTN